MALLGEGCGGGALLEGVPYCVQGLVAGTHFLFAFCFLTEAAMRSASAAVFCGHTSSSCCCSDFPTMMEGVPLNYKPGCNLPPLNSFFLGQRHVTYNEYSPIQSLWMLCKLYLVDIPVLE